MPQSRSFRPWRFLPFVIGMTIAMVLALSVSPALPAAERLRVIIETDCGGDTDDQGSLTRLLLHADLWDIEGIICNDPSTSNWPLTSQKTGLDLARLYLDAYGDALPNLLKHSSKFPSKETLMARTVAGAASGDNPAVALLIAAGDRADPRPIWFANWGTNQGGQFNLNYTLAKLKQTRSTQAYAAFRDKWLLTRNNPPADVADMRLWVNTRDPNSFYHAWSPCTAGSATLFNADTDLRTNHGRLPSYYPGTKEGDSASLVYLLPTGMNDPMHPDWGSWGGRYGHVPNAPASQWYANATDTFNGSTSRENTIKRWADPIENEFKARADWCVADAFAKGNHAPVAGIDGDVTQDILTRTATVGSTLVFNATGSSDPDGDGITYRWFVYGEAGTYPASPALTGATTAQCQLTVPADAAGKTIHVVLMVTDDDRHRQGLVGSVPWLPAPVPLTRCRRVIITGVAASGNRPPTAILSVTPNSGPAPLTVQCDGRGSSDPDQDPLTWNWDFGDGGTAQGATASHSFSTAGSYVVRLTVSDGRGGQTSTSATVVVSPAPTAGSIAMSGATAVIGEGGVALTLTATRSGGSAGAVSVTFATADGTAKAGSDYTATSGSLTWAAGDAAAKIITVPIADDALVEGDETFSVTLSTPTGGAILGSPTVTTVTIADNDAAGGTGLTIQNTTVASGKAYVWDTLQIGKQPYIDRTFTVSAIPAVYAGAAFLRTANDDKAITGNSFITFSVNQDVTVTVAYDDRIAPRPSWLGGWTDTGDNMVSGGGTFSLLTRTFPVGTVTLGGNAGPTASMYTVVVQALGAVPDTAPTISAIANRSTTTGVAISGIAITVGDLETAPGSLTLSGSSSNTMLLPNAGISFGGSGASRTVTVTPAANQTGTATVTIAVSDGTLSASTSFVLTVTSSTAPGLLVNFQPATSPVPAGYLVDSGAVFAPRGNGQDYGWSRDVSTAARDRNASASPDQRYDTLVQMQKQSPGAVWEIAVANGTYQVRIVRGDPSFTDQIDALTVEGVAMPDPDGQDHFDDDTVTVTVNDGRLTVAPAATASNAKLCFIEIIPVPGGAN